MRLQYEVRVMVNPPLVVIVDRAGTARAGVKTVTNAAEEVAADLARRIPDLRSRRVIYRDTAGYWDELILNERGEFVAYGLLRARTEREAIAETLRTKFDQTGQPMVPA